MKTAILNVYANSRGNFHGRSTWEDARDIASRIEQDMGAFLGLSWFDDDFGRHIVSRLQEEIEKLDPHFQKMISLEIIDSDIDIED